MNDYSENTRILYEQKLVNDSEIYEIEGTYEEDEFTLIFNFYKGNLEHLKKYGCNPSYFFIRNKAGLDAKARKWNNSYIIGINYEVLRTLFNKYKTYFEVTEIEGLEDYSDLRSILKNNLHDLLYEAILHFNFYHEWAHLLQFKAEDSNETSFHESQNVYDEKSHINEMDADCVSAYSCSAHFYQYLEKHTTQIANKEQTEKYLGLGIAGTVLYIMEFIEEIDCFYLKERKYPHPSIRICNVTNEIIDYFLHLQKVKKIKKEYQIDKSAIGKEFQNVISILAKYFRTDHKYHRVKELIRDHTEEIGQYILDAKNEINQNQNSAVNERNNRI